MSVLFNDPFDVLHSAVTVCSLMATVNHLCYYYWTLPLCTYCFMFAIISAVGPRYIPVTVPRPMFLSVDQVIYSQ